MPTYVYETIPENEQDVPDEFEIVQRMSDAPLTTHPETGQAVRRVISGGLALPISSKKGSCCEPKSKCSCG